MPKRVWVGGIGGVIIVLAFAAAMAAGVSLVYSGPSRSFCGSCHEIAPAVASATRSVHSDVPCLSCHERSGVLGVAAYTPTFALELGQRLTGWPVASNVLPARDCVSCHERLPDAHPGDTADCRSCHGNTAHAGPDRPLPVPHLQGYDLTHGADVVDSGTGPCASCHDVAFCSACHVDDTFPHADDWLASHGTSDLTSCTNCHPATYCSGCHGTELPHASDWLATHYRAVQGSQASACATCHAPSDCDVCHARHQVHREQSLYEWETGR